MTAKQKIMERLALADGPIPIHEIKAYGVSDTSCSARLRELHRAGSVIKHKVIGKRFDYWSLTPDSDIDFSQPYKLGGIE